MKLVELLQLRAATALDDLPEAQVRELQTALGEAGFDPQGVDGTMGPDTKSAWAEFKDATSEDNPDVIGPGSVGELQKMLDTAGALIPSGPIWVPRFPNSTSVDDLRGSFKEGCVAFLSALRSAGVNVTVTSTLRPPQRAFLMHFAKAIAEGDISPSQVEHRADIPIQWVHPTNAASVDAAQAMVAGYGIMGPVALDSNHIRGQAIDMFISWSGTPSVRDAAGNPVSLVGEPDANNAALVRTGATYGVIRGRGITGDPEHWSFNGR